MAMTPMQPLLVPQRPRRLWPWIVGGGLFCALLAIVLLLAAAMAWQSRGQSELDAALEVVRRDGGPTTAAELEAFYERPPAEKDATQLWLDGIAAFEQPSFEQEAEGLPIIGDAESTVPLPGEDWKQLLAVEQFLERHAGSLAKLHEATELGGAARYPTQFQQGYGPQLSHWDGISQAARMLWLEGHVHAHRHDSRGAAKSLQAALYLPNSLRHEPQTMSQLMRAHLIACAADQLTAWLPHVGFTDDELKQLQLTLRLIDYDDGWKRALKGDRTLTLIALNDPAGLGSNSFEMWRRGWPLARLAAARIHLKFMNAQLAAAHRPWPEALIAVQHLEQDIDKRSAHGSKYVQLKYALSASSSATTLFAAIARAEAHRDAVDSAIAVERFRHRHHRMPSQLADLVPDFLPAVPLDPFDGRPLRYVVRPNEYVIYNVGADGIDNLGVVDQSGKPDDPFVVPLVPLPE